MVGFMDPDRVYKDVVNKHEPMLCGKINPQEMLPYFKEILTQRAVEEITCEQRNYGSTTAVPKLLSEIKRKRGWFPILIRALLQLGHDDIADTLDPGHTVPRTDGAAAGSATQNPPFGLVPPQQAQQSSDPSRQGPTDGNSPPDPHVAPFSIQDTQPHERPDHGQTGVVVTEEEDAEKKDGGDDRDEKDEEMLSVEGVNSVDVFVRRRVDEGHRAPGRTYAEEDPTEDTGDGAVGEEPTALFEEPVDEKLDGSPQPIGARTREIQEEEMQKIKMKEAHLKSDVQPGRSSTPIAFLIQKEYDARGAEGNRSDGGKGEGNSGSSFELPPGFHDSVEEHWNLGGTEALPPNNELSSPPDRPEPLQKIDNITRAESQGKSAKDPPGLGPTGVVFISGADKRVSAATVCDGRENELATEPKEPVQPSDNGDGMNDYMAEASHANISGTVKITAPKDTEDASPADAQPTDLPSCSKPSSPNKPKAPKSASKPDHNIKDRPTDVGPRKPPPPSTPQTSQRRHTIPERTAEENNSRNANKDTHQKASTEKDAGGGVDSATVLQVAGILGVTCLAIYRMINR
ncbi:PREDICTED: uncharacterized protein LOC109478579 [Branchiostoma belcheri]|uniref:Uncharacterized protein LOC109478579 n=1 Tax=Branchiostoma belcheri TaxID=7741 RepID=A0A6P5A1Y5_BRABE|nr:PREDICTED: uncharacterized protein LOC109478579 [Branchiostoma belcheri]XP_019635795.1 PREDICTED: uncharacterized protein LOC109478579 [Branchiostoma belcheri]XP_019635796.1 PREDICTED: uncharacterized protein LOC109478579 [Branchiostoma belcheri]XP_019635797.1 PREDICTED: uncharacterized protein LOC109478579 [Branchiostoma belcheri]